MMRTSNRKDKKKKDGAVHLKEYLEAVARRTDVLFKRNLENISRPTLLQVSV